MFAYRAKKTVVITNNNKQLDITDSKMFFWPHRTFSGSKLTLLIIRL